MLARYRLTIIGFGVAVITFSVSWIFQFDLMERAVIFLQSLYIYEHYELDELLLPLMILGLFALLDQRRRRRLQQFEQEKVQLYRAMLASNHHILNNFLNQLQMFRLTAEDTPGFPADELLLFDQIIKDTVRQIHNLETVTGVDGEKIYAAVMPQTQTPGSPRKTLRQVFGTFLL
jgi:hypothetical protein